jgi:hypothetical protein
MAPTTIRACFAQFCSLGMNTGMSYQKITPAEADTADIARVQRGVPVFAVVTFVPCQRALCRVKLAAAVAGEHVCGGGKAGMTTKWWWSFGGQFKYPFSLLRGLRGRG